MPNVESIDISEKKDPCELGRWIQSVFAGNVVSIEIKMGNDDKLTANITYQD